MNEVFYEESAEIKNVKSAKTKYNVYNIFSIVFIVLSLLWVSIAFTAYPLSGNWLVDLFGMVTPLIVFVPSAILFRVFKNKFYVDFDYTFISGSVRVSKVIRNVKRKFVLKFETSDLEKLGKFGSETYLKYEKQPGVKKMIFTLNAEPKEGKDFYYLVATVNAEKLLMIFECTELFMVNVLKFSNKAIVEEDFK